MEKLGYTLLGADSQNNSQSLFISNSYPCCADLALDENKSINEVAVTFPSNAQVEFEVFTSLDGVRYDKFENTEAPARFVRIFIKYYSSDCPEIKNVEVLGVSCSVPKAEAPFCAVCDFQDSEYNKIVTDNDIYKDVFGIIGRAIGEKYTSFFELIIDRKMEADSFLVESKGDKIVLASNCGVGLAGAFNCYLQEVCGCHISRFGKQVSLPENLPSVKQKIERKTSFNYRYAYNYCAHSYSMPFWGEDEWQKEIDYLAMNGVNLVLDITGMEEVYRRFLTRLGYSHYEIKKFITGPAYYAWFYMNNIYGAGGPIHDGFFAERCELARKNHLRMKTLGMDVILQAYTGMVPDDIQKKDKNAPVIPQGLWNNMPRPLVISPESETYAEYAKMFYECQREVFGDITHFYAGDICHEGGKLEKSKAKDAFLNVMESMISQDKNAVWVVQSWGSNPTKTFTKALKKYRNEHILMLDLYAERRPHSKGCFSQLAKFNYLFGMINSFGGRNGIYGNLDTLSTQIAKSARNKNFRGIALTSESNSVNPIMLDIFFSTVWEDVRDMDKWMKNYCKRRYASNSDNLYNAVKILSQTALCEKKMGQGEGAPECALCARPEGSVHKACCWAYTKYNYSNESFDEAVRLFLADYDEQKDNECYIYDAVDLLRQSLSNRINKTLDDMMKAYDSKNSAEFKKYSDRLLYLADMLDKVLLNSGYWSLSSWLGYAEKFCENNDDFTKELYMINAKALITTWYSRAGSDGEGYLHDYANRQLGGLVSSFYKMRWQTFIDKANAELNGAKAQKTDWFKLEWDWVLYDEKFSGDIRSDNLKALCNEILG